MIRFLIVIIVMNTAHPLLAQTCSNDMPRSRPDSRYSTNESGVVIDNMTDRMWMRCSLGQTWSNDTCIGMPREYTWGEALVAADSHAFAGYSDWYLPNVKELMSLIEHACFNPAINIAAFPGVLSSWTFWSSTQSQGEGTQFSAFTVWFGYGDTRTARDRALRFFVRPVRQVE